MDINKEEDNIENSAQNFKFQTFANYSGSYLKNRGLKTVLFEAVLVVMFLSSAVLAVYFYLQYNTVKLNPQKITQDERAALMAQVSRLIVLPPGEDPTLATVSNIDVLRAQPFFSNAKNGDRVLIYANARKAILYDPVNDKIVEVAPIVIGNPQPPAAKAK